MTADNVVGIVNGSAFTRRMIESALQTGSKREEQAAVLEISVSSLRRLLKKM